MRNLAKKGAALLLAAIMTAGTVTGCGSEKMDSSVMAVYGDETISKEEAIFLAKYIQYSYEYMYSSYYSGYGMSSSDIWSNQGQTGSTMEDTAKTSVMSELLQTRILCDEAEKEGITLSEEEQTKVDEAVAEFMNMTEVVEASGVTEDTVRNVLTNNAIANKMYEAMVADIDMNVDEEEVLNKTMAVVTISQKEDTAETETQDTSETAEAVEETKSSEEIQEIKQRMEELGDTIQKELEEGKSTDEIKTEYAENEFDVAVSASTAVSKSSTFAYTEQAMALAQGECAKTISNSDEQDPVVYVVRCEEEKNEEATEQAIETELESRRSEMFAEKYKALSENAPAFKVNEDEWELITFKEPLYEAPESSEVPVELEGETESFAEETETAGETVEDEVSSEESEVISEAVEDEAQTVIE